MPKVNETYKQDNSYSAVLKVSVLHNYFRSKSRSNDDCSLLAVVCAVRFEFILPLCHGHKFTLCKILKIY